MGRYVPFLLGIQHVPGSVLENFNIIKKQQDPVFKPLLYRFDIDRVKDHSLRTDPLWGKLMDAFWVHIHTGRIQSADMYLQNFWDCQHVRIEYVREEELPYIVVEDDDGRERIRINPPSQ
jgi:hypothetical protein